MDGFTIGLILRQLLASAGLKATIAIVVLGGFAYVAFRAARAVGSFGERLIANRDQMLSQTLERIAESDARRAVVERETAGILATINTKLDAAHEVGLEAAREFKELKGVVQEIRGAVR